MINLFKKEESGLVSGFLQNCSNKCNYNLHHPSKKVTNIFIDWNLMKFLRRFLELITIMAKIESILQIA